MYNINELIEKLTKKHNSEWLAKAVKEIKDKYDIEIDYDSAILMLAKKEKIDFGKDNDGKISVRDLKDKKLNKWYKNILEAIVLEVNDPITTKNGFVLRKIQLVAPFPLYLNLWESMSKLAITEGMKLEIAGFRISEYEGVMEITPSQYGSFKRYSDNELKQS